MNHPGPTVSWAVVGHPAREHQARALATHLDAALTLDTDGRGCDTNHLRAWNLTTRTTADWAGVAEDDAIPGTDIGAHLATALPTAPAPVVSLYLGRSRPVRWQPHIARATRLADRHDASWITCSRVLHAVTVLMHTDLVPDWLAFAATSTLAIDERLSAWCRTRRHPVAYPWPSLTDHRDGPTLVRHPDGQPRTQPRTAWRTGTRTTWTSKAVRM